MNWGLWLPHGVLKLNSQLPTSIWPSFNYCSHWKFFPSTVLFSIGLTFQTIKKLINTSCKSVLNLKCIKFYDYILISFAKIFFSSSLFNHDASPIFHSLLTFILKLLSTSKLRSDFPVCIFHSLMHFLQNSELLNAQVRARCGQDSGTPSRSPHG